MATPMASQLGSKESLDNFRTASRCPCPQRSWYRRVVTFPRRKPTNQTAPHAHISLASEVPLVVGWSHAVTSGSHHGASMWFTTLCALSVALGALSYNLMAVLAEFFSFDNRLQKEQSRTYLHGVDVTNSRYFQHSDVLAAVDFAAAAHAHQRRKTGEPYVTHCIETALIVEACFPPAHSAAEQERHVSCIMAAVLHDVIDDTPIELTAMQQAFGPRVAALVAQVSKLSQMNQLLRRGKRQGWAQYSPDHLKQLRKLIVDLASEEPLVVLVKLADRLHNMRTVYVLPPDRQRSVAEETREVWVSMAESLGWDGLKSEMEDLCFGVLQPSTYCTLRGELDRLWSLPTLAVVEEQLEDEAAAAVPGRGDGSGDGSGGSSGDLGLRIVQVSGPEAPIRHYTRAAGVRAAVAQAAAEGAVQQPRRRRPGQGPRKTAGGVAIAAAEENGDARWRLQSLATEAADAAEVPHPPPLPVAPLPPPAQATGPLQSVVSAAVPALAVAALSSSTSPVSVLEFPRDSGGAGRTRSSTGLTSGPSVRLAVAEKEEKEEGVASSAVAVSRNTSYPPGDGDSSVPLSSVSAQLSYSSSITGSATALASTDSAAAGAVDLGWMPYDVQHGAGCATDAETGVGSNDGGDNGLLIQLSISGGGVGLGTATPLPLASYDTLESMDGPLMLDRLVLPLGLTAVATDGCTNNERGSSSSKSGANAYNVTSETSSAAAAISRIAGSEVVMGSTTSDSRATSSSPPAPTISSHGISNQQPKQPQHLVPAQVAAAAEAALAAVAGVVAATATSPDTVSPAASAGGSPFSDRPPPPSVPLSPLSPQQDRLRLILSTVVPFECVGFKDLRGMASSTRRGLEVLDECAALLYNEIQIRSQAGGLGINIQGRLKSLHSVYSKMLRKNVAVAQVYDSRALRVIVDDVEGSSLQEAVEVCYRLVGAVHSIWKPIKMEFDDYIANPKQSGYQSLHTAVRGPGGIPMEVQIKTSSMHELAEYGAAAHWVYKEHTPVLQSPGRARGGGSGSGNARGLVVERLPAGFVGQPVLKVAKDKLRYGVVVARPDEGQRLIAAVKLGATLQPFPTRVPDYSFYSGLLGYTRGKGWQVPGHGDLMLRLEEYVKCDDGRYHRRDHLGYLLPAETLTPLEGYEEDAVAAREEEQRKQQQQGLEAVLAVAPGEGGGGGALALTSSAAGAAVGGGVEATDIVRGSVDDDAAGGSKEQQRFREQMRIMFLKTQRLRSMLAWGDGAIGKYAAADYPSDEVSVLIWPGGRIEHVAKGTTAGDIVAAKGLVNTGGSEELRLLLLINVNNRLVPENTVLNDGDLVILAREKVRI